MKVNDVESLTIIEQRELATPRCCACCVCFIPWRLQTRKMRIATVVSFVGLLILIAILSYMILLFSPVYPCDAEARFLKSSDNVTFVDSDGWYLFKPAQISRYSYNPAALVLYVGAKMEAGSFADLGYKIAERGHVVAIVKSPLNYAFFSVYEAANVKKSIQASLPSNINWSIGGHSLGGSMACTFMSDADYSVWKGLVVLASLSTQDLSQKSFKCSLQWATNDGFNQGDSAKWLSESLKHLPSSTVVTKIDGGNHANFGCINKPMTTSAGYPVNDGVATITVMEQHAIIVNATVSLLESL